MLQIERRGPITTLTLNRPEVRNAFNAELIEELRNALEDADRRRDRVVVLRGNGPAFCAGGDLNWMRDQAHHG
ncbi:MAG: enoyl-CoA hydratase-related protein, partial [Fimbriimonadaceae bacterium]|nr:enoyl-CoA hydratase-related protein [Fimbriimonadaceae bacterium]